MTRLADFVASAHHRVAAGRYACVGPPLERNGLFVAAIARDPDAIVAECKPRSPSGGRLLHGTSDELLQAYRWGGATALSALADADHFGGGPELVRAAHATGLAVLWKDFVVDEAQIACAAHHGVSAVLIIERVFADDPARREELVQAAHTAGLEVLLELHARDDVRRAVASRADMLGINARDLDSLEVDTAAALQLVRRLAADRRPVLALSGVRDRRDRLAAKAAGAAGVLVGTSLMTAPDPGLALRALRCPLAKVCGIRDATGLQVAADAGSDMVGFVVGAPKSPREVSPSQARHLRDQAVALGLRTVLVTPHEDPQDVLAWCQVVRPDHVQLVRLRPDGPWLRRLASIPVVPLHVVPPQGPLPSTGGVLVDTPHPSGGGSGTTHDWDQTARLLDGARGRLTLVAGGLGPDNVQQALRTTGAWGADASSRLESAPGSKDAKSVTAFVRAVQEAT